ncbi:RtcB family protein [Cellulosimicrobium sp. TH-20]|uniref:RtcB family protein n=1 Tax=Cellulosimicrobium sp. TH-20 TaxID=1980001 RepID=UPI0011A7FC1D|nr:RtcB family protein [Cellulosimicrobium sp. TH-20]
MPEKIGDKLVSWASILEDDTRAQAARTASLPFVQPHLALMPDAHLGKGATVGSVIPTEGAIIPAAVGVDIGCGMDAVRTQWTVDDLPSDLRPLREDIERRIPLSAGKYNTELTPSARVRVNWLAEKAVLGLDSPSGKHGFQPDQYAKNWHLQLGSLGSGNHFCEVSADLSGRVWLFLHSGSRGVGNKIAQRHIEVARGLMRKWHIDLPDPDLAYLAEGTPEFDAYIAELRWAQAFARANRAEMMDRVVEAAATFMGAPVERQRSVSCHHNYTERERHFGRDLWVSRKGAIDAHAGVWGLIPGSMGDRSYVVVGKGDRASLCSAPHGAGREYSRSKAKKAFTMDSLRERMAGIEWSGSEEFLDEHPAAYKPIDVVMDDARDLVEVRYELRQLINVKGD